MAGMRVSEVPIAHTLCGWVWVQVVGAVGLEVWVESSGPDLDLFAYLEDVDEAGSIRWALYTHLTAKCLGTMNS